MYIHLQIDLYLSISDDEIIAKHAQLVKKKKKKDCLETKSIHEKKTKERKRRRRRRRKRKRKEVLTNKRHLIIYCFLLKMSLGAFNHLFLFLFLYIILKIIGILKRFPDSSLFSSSTNSIDIDHATHFLYIVCIYVCLFLFLLFFFLSHIRIHRHRVALLSSLSHSSFCALDWRIENNPFCEEHSDSITTIRFAVYIHIQVLMYTNNEQLFARF